MVEKSSAVTQRLKTMFRDEALWITEYGGVCTVIWRDQVTLERFDRQRECLADVVARHPGKAGFMCVVEAHVKPPPEELRKASVDMIKGHGAKLVCVAGIIEADGFMGSLTRSVLSGMLLLSGRRATAQAFFPSVSDGARWIAQQLQIDGKALASSVAQQREGFSATARFAARH